MDILNRLYKFEDMSNEDVLLNNGFQNVNQLICYSNHLKDEIERLNKCIKDDKENADEIIVEQQKEIEKLKGLVIALWHNDNARLLNKEQIDLLNNVVFGNDEEDLGVDKE